MIQKVKDKVPLIMCTTLAAGIITSAGAAQHQIREQGIRLRAVEERQAEDHDELIEIGVNVRWIKDSMTRQDGSS